SAVSSPYLPRRARLLVLLSTNPLSWLVNHTTNFCTCPLRSLTISAVTVLIRSVVVCFKSSARMYRDWSNADANSTMAISFEYSSVKDAGVSRGWTLCSSLFAESRAAPGFGRHRQSKRPTRQHCHEPDE